jgi:hypothetical protein
VPTGFGIRRHDKIKLDSLLVGRGLAEVRRICGLEIGVKRIEFSRMPPDLSENVVDEAEKMGAGAEIFAEDAAALAVGGGFFHSPSKLFKEREIGIAEAVDALALVADDVKVGGKVGIYG